MEDFIKEIENAKIQIAISQVQTEQALDTVKKLANHFDDLHIKALEKVELKIEADRLASNHN